MTTSISEAWISRVERGPDWLFVRLRTPDQPSATGCAVAEPVWRAMQDHVLRRVVLELDEVSLLRSELIRELILLLKRVELNGGLLRLAGMSDHHQQVLELCRLADRFPRYPDRHAAVMATTSGRAIQATPSG